MLGRQLIRCFLCQYEHLSLIRRAHIKHLGEVACARHPSVWEAGTEIPGGHWLASLAKLQVKVKEYQKTAKPRWTAASGMTPESECYMHACYPLKIRVEKVLS